MLDATASLAYYNIIEAGVTVLCAALIASKPVIMYLLPDPLIERIRARFQQPWTRQTKSRTRANNRDARGLTLSHTIHHNYPSDTSLGSLAALTVGYAGQPIEMAGSAGTQPRIRLDSEDTLVVPHVDQNGIIRTITVDKKVVPGGKYGAPAPGGKF